MTYELQYSRWGQWISFRNYRQAERMVELLYENDWDINKRDELKQQVMMEWKEKKRNTANVVIPGDQEQSVKS